MLEEEEIRREILAARMRTIILFTLLTFATCIVIAPISAQAPIEFEGTVITDETVSFPVCYNMPHCEVIVDTVFYDPNNTLTIGQNVTICYDEALNLIVGDQVHCYGHYWVIGPCPLQFCGYVTGTEIVHTRIPQLAVDPPEATVGVGQVFDINITIRDLDIRWRLQGVAFNLSYLPVLTILDVTEGPFMSQFLQLGDPDGGIPPQEKFFHWFIEANHLFVMNILLPSPSGKWCCIYPEGDGVLATITFSADSPGSTSLDLITTDLSDEIGTQIPHTTMHGTIEIRESFPYDMNLDLRVDIEDIVIAALAFGAQPDHSRWNSQADVNNDSVVNIIDLYTIAHHFGTTYP
jgi:hypothetical protein